MRFDADNVSPPKPAVKPYTPRKAELIERHREFVAAAAELLHLLRETGDGSCVACGAARGKQHRKGQVCMRLVLWRAASQYGEEAAHDTR